MARLEANSGVEFSAELVAIPRDEAAASAKGVNRRGDKAREAPSLYSSDQQLPASPRNLPAILPRSEL